MELTLTGASTLSDKGELRSSVTKDLELSAITTPPENNSQSNSSSIPHEFSNDAANNTQPLLDQTQNPNNTQGSGHCQRHTHSHSRALNHNGSQPCCQSHASRPAPAAMDVPSLLPSKEQVQRFKSDKLYRLAVLSNVVRGGTYEVFVNLVTVLALDEKNVKSDKGLLTLNADDEADSGASVDKPRELILDAKMLDGYGLDGHTLAHWCAKRGDDQRFLAFLISRSYTAPNGTQLLINLHLPSKDSVGMYPLHWAVTEGAIPLVSMLLQHLEDRPTPPPSLRSPENALSCNVPSSSSLMKDDDEISANNCDNHSSEGIDVRDASGCTPLLIASQYGHPDLAAFLIRRGADPTAADSSLDTALHWAAYKGSLEVCGMLLHLQGAEGQIDGIDAFGQTPLHLASLRGNVETVRFLMEEAGCISSALPGGVGVGTAGRIGSRGGRNPSSGIFPAKLLSKMDKDKKTPLDLAIKKKKVGCELLLRQYEERYLFPKRPILARMGQACRDIWSIRNWKAWMGIGGSELPVSQNPTFPFYWMTVHILLAGVIYATKFIGLGTSRRYSSSDDGLLWDRLGLHFFFMMSWTATWSSLYFTWKTNPGVLDARGSSDSSSPLQKCLPIRCNGDENSKDTVSREMDSITKELRRQYDAVIESFSKDFPSPEKRVPLCHTCRIVKPLRSKHCRVARRCVLMFDHHCPFVGATIGLYNYIYFYSFLVCFCLMGSGFITAWILVLKRSQSFVKDTFFLGCYFSLYIVPVLMMVVYHTQLVLNNVSTNEQLNFVKYQYFWSENGQFRNPFDNGKIKNILQRLSPDRSSYELTRNRTSPEDSLDLQSTDEEKEMMLRNIV